MAGIFDWLEQNKGVSDVLFGSVLPSVLSSAFTDRPDTIDPAQLARMYTMMSQGVTDANNFAKQQAQFYQQNYIPMAQAIAGRAQGIGQGQDLQRTIDRTTADVDSAYRTRADTYERDLQRRGVDPTSAAALAGKVHMQDNYVPDKLTALNQAITTREQYGDTARQQALQNLNTRPDFMGAAYGAGSAAGQLGSYNLTQQNQYRQDLATTSGGLASMWDKYAKQRDRQYQLDQNAIMGNMKDIVEKGV